MGRLAITSFDWAGHVVNHLCEAVKTFQGRKHRYIGGCVRLFIVFYECKMSKPGSPFQDPVGQPRYVRIEMTTDYRKFSNCRT
ncbi:hypothetical protein MLD38_018771 [Melastoma candidum]|uniref:Uncharacterized protein n=1 Tax=Melastoma candidum TaxID=119954 RepID=A0ACB9R347_9MYRT|nr:hypothetical protein MLD38_018771 [Melastoma candidum]